MEKIYILVIAIVLVIGIGVAASDSILKVVSDVITVSVEVEKFITISIEKPSTPITFYFDSGNEVLSITRDVTFHSNHKVAIEASFNAGASTHPDINITAEFNNSSNVDAGVTIRELIIKADYSNYTGNVGTGDIVEGAVAITVYSI